MSTVVADSINLPMYDTGKGENSPAFCQFWRSLISFLCSNTTLVHFAKVVFKKKY